MNSNFLSKVEKTLKKQGYECYILMVCNKSSKEELLVEMSYDGDEVLGCYMLENALSIFDQKVRKPLEESQTPPSSDITPLGELP